MRVLAHVLLHEPNSLTPGERELIATYVRRTTATSAKRATEQRQPLTYATPTWCRR
jgi:hypothetical protein